MTAYRRIIHRQATAGIFGRPAVVTLVNLDKDRRLPGKARIRARRAARRLANQTSGGNRTPAGPGDRESGKTAPAGQLAVSTPDLARGQASSDASSLAHGPTSSSVSAAGTETPRGVHRAEPASLNPSAGDAAAATPGRRGP